MSSKTEGDFTFYVSNDDGEKYGYISLPSGQDYLVGADYSIGFDMGQLVMTCDVLAFPPEILETGAGVQIPSLVLMADSALELEALRTLVYDAREQGHPKADMWAHALEEFRAFREDND